MQLTRLEIHDVASIGDATIDFTQGPLSGTSVFLICGETGAGKSTILDCMCLALYGKTPRMEAAYKEDTGLRTGDGDTKSYANDNEQLLRRGSGRGWSRLHFTGNDGRDYVAEWEIHRDHYKANKKLQSANRQLHATDGSFAENRVKPIQEKILDITGMDYMQFCRTVMLAQGEFTKFLKSRANEKAEILEKITGTGLYSRIGMKIAEHYQQKRETWRRASEAVSNIELLSDEDIASKQTELEEKRKSLALEIKAQTDMMKKTGWLETERSLKMQLDGKQKELETVQATLQTESYSNRRRFLDQYDASAEGRRLTEAIRKDEVLLKSKEEAIPALETALKLNAKKELERKAESTEKSSAVKKQEQVVEDLAMESLNKDMEMLNGRKDKLVSLKTAIGKLSDRLKHRTEIIKDLKDTDFKRRSAEESIKRLKPQVEKAGKAVAEAGVALQTVELSLSDAARQLRSTLKEGDLCPVCGQKVLDAVNDTVFQSLLLPLQEKKRAADDALLALKTEYKVNEGTVSESVKHSIDNKRRLDRVDDECLGTLGKIKEERRSLVSEGINALCRGNQPLADAVDTELEVLKKRTAAIREKQIVGENESKKLKELRTASDTAMEKLMRAAAKSSQSDAALKTAVAERDAVKTRIADMNGELAEFMSKTPGVTADIIDGFLLVKEGELDQLRNDLNTIEEASKNLGIEVTALRKQMDNHIMEKPEFAEGEDLETLLTLGKESNDRRDLLSSAIGAIENELRADSDKRKACGKRMEQAAAAKEELELWEGLYNRLGDQKGSKFRTVAQSFILQSLLESANRYMTCFNDRYTLTCTPGTLTIMVIDAHRPSEPQPASILSGGESFMASLALALGLAGLDGLSIATDVIFIDEGFGSLSGNYLGNVMETLEKLHMMGGRKVGIISHVAEMRERIPVHIEVTRESPAVSRIDIIG